AHSSALFQEGGKKNMCSGMMFGMAFWWILGTLLPLALIAAVIWLLAQAFRAFHQPPTPPQWYQQGPQPHQRSAPGTESQIYQGPQPYQRSTPGTGGQTYEEGGRTYSYPAQSSPPEQQEH